MQRERFVCLDEKRAVEVVETGIGSMGRIKILRLLVMSRGEALTKYAIESRSGLRHKDIVNNLEILVKIDWVEQLPSKPKKYRINPNDQIVEGLLEFFYKVGYV